MVSAHGDEFSCGGHYLHSIPTMEPQPHGGTGALLHHRRGCVGYNEMLFWIHQVQIEVTLRAFPTGGRGCLGTVERRLKHGSIAHPFPDYIGTT